MKLLSFITLLGLSTLGYATQCPGQKNSPGKEILCYTSSKDLKTLTGSICRCTTLVHQGYELHNLSSNGLQEWTKSVKDANPVIQVVISVTDPQNTLKSSAHMRQDASARLANILSEIDGIELDMNAGSKERLTHFLKSLKDEMVRKSNEKRILLALPTKSEELAKQYDLKALTKYVDLFTLATHYLVDADEAFHAFHPSRLMGIFDMLNTDSLVDLISGLGAPKTKLVVSLPASAYKFTLRNAKENTPRSPVAEEEPTTISQKQLCELMSSGEWTVERDTDLTAPYTFKDSAWIAYEDKTSVGIKGKYVLLRELAGLGIHEIENDVKTDCGKSITEEVYRSFTGMRRKTRRAVLTSLENDIHHAEIPYSTNVKSSGFRIVRVVDTAGKIHAIRENTWTEFMCTRQGYFVHPKSCNRFYRCVKFDQGVDDYSVFEFDCPAGLAFDERTEVCVWPGSISEGSACLGSSEIAPVPRARFRCPEHPGYYADPQNCRWFFACFDLGEPELMAYEFRCPFGLVFDEQKLICEWPWMVPGCGVAAYSRTEYGSGSYSGGIGTGHGGAAYIEDSVDGGSVAFGGRYPGAGIATGSESHKFGVGTGEPRNSVSSSGIDGFIGEGGQQSGYYGAGGNEAGYSRGKYPNAVTGSSVYSGSSHDGAGKFGTFNSGVSSGTSGYTGVDGSGSKYSGSGTTRDSGSGSEAGGDSGSGADGLGYSGSKYSGTGNLRLREGQAGSTRPVAARSGYSGSGAAGPRYSGSVTGYSGSGAAGAGYSRSGAGYSGSGAAGAGYSGSGAARAGYSGLGADYPESGAAGAGYSGSVTAGSYSRSGAAGGSDSGSGTTGAGYSETEASYSGSGVTRTGYAGLGATGASYAGSAAGGAEYSGSVVGGSESGPVGSGYSGSAVVGTGYSGSGAGGANYSGSVAGKADTIHFGSGGARHAGSTATDSRYSGYTGNGAGYYGHTESKYSTAGKLGYSGSTSGESEYAGAGASGYSTTASDDSFAYSGSDATGTKFNPNTGTTSTDSIGYSDSGTGGSGETVGVEYSGAGVGSTKYSGSDSSGTGFAGSVDASEGHLGAIGSGYTLVGHTGEGSVGLFGTTHYGPGVTSSGEEKLAYNGVKNGILLVSPGVIESTQKTYTTGPYTNANIASVSQYGDAIGSGAQKANGGSSYTSVTRYDRLSQAGTKSGQDNSYHSVITENVSGATSAGLARESDRYLSLTADKYSAPTNIAEVQRGNGGSAYYVTGGTGNGHVDAGLNVQSVTPGYGFGSTVSTTFGESTSIDHGQNGAVVTGSAYGLGNTGSGSHAIGVSTIKYHGNAYTGSTGTKTDDAGLNFIQSGSGDKQNVYTGSGSAESSLSTSRGTDDSSNPFSIMSGTVGTNRVGFGTKYSGLSDNKYHGQTISNDEGYQTNEYHDNGGRGTIRYNNGYIASKYTESDVKDRGTNAYTTIPDTSVPGVGIEESGGVVLSNNLAGLGAYGNNGFSNSRATTTSFKSSKTGESTSYLGGEQQQQPTSAYRNTKTKASYAHGLIHSTSSSYTSDFDKTAFVGSTSTPNAGSPDGSGITLGYSGPRTSSGYFYQKPTVQLATSGIRVFTQSPLTDTYHEPVAPLTVTTPPSHLNVEVYNTPFVLPSAPITAAPAVVNTYSYRKPQKTTYQQTLYQAAKVPTLTTIDAGYTSQKQRQNGFYANQQQYTVTPTAIPIARYTNPAEAYKSTLYQAAKLPVPVSTVVPIRDTGYKTAVSTSDSPIEVTTRQYYYKDSRFRNTPVSVTEESGHLPITGKSHIVLQNQYDSVSTISTTSGNVGYSYEKPTKKPTYGSVSTTTPSVAVYKRPSVTVQHEVEYTPVSTIAPNVEESYYRYTSTGPPAHEQSVSEQSYIPVSTTTEGYVYSKPVTKFIATTSTSSQDYIRHNGGPPAKLDISRGEVGKLINNYERGSIRYTPNVYDVYSGDAGRNHDDGSSNKGYNDARNTGAVASEAFVSTTVRPFYESSRTSSPAVSYSTTARQFYQSTGSTPGIVSYTTTALPWYEISQGSSSGTVHSSGAINSNVVTGFDSRGYNYGSEAGYSSTPLYESTSIKLSKGKGKVIVKLSDLHPLLLGKLGAQCTCKADPFAALRGPGSRKSLPINSSKGNIDLANYDESDVYVDLDGNREPEESITVLRTSPNHQRYTSASTTRSTIAVTTHRPSEIPAGVLQVKDGTPRPFSRSREPSSNRFASSTIKPFDESGGDSMFEDVQLRNGASPSPDSSNFEIGDAAEGRSANSRRKSAKSSREFNVPGNAIGDQGAAFDRYGPGGWRGIDETLQGTTDCARPGLFRHPKYCNKFYACHFDEWKQKYTLHVFNCPVHLSFDGQAGACNWPSKGPACQDDNLLI